MIITKAWLEEKGACKDGMTWFEGKYGVGAEVEAHEVARNVPTPEWVTWLAKSAGLTSLPEGWNPEWADLTGCTGLTGLPEGWKPE